MHNFTYIDNNGNLKTTSPRNTANSEAVNITNIEIINSNYIKSATVFKSEKTHRLIIEFLDGASKFSNARIEANFDLDTKTTANIFTDGINVRQLHSLNYNAVELIKNQRTLEVYIIAVTSPERGA